MDYVKCGKVAALFLGGALFGSFGVQLLTSRDARKVYTHVTAAVLRCKESVMTTVTALQETAGDILADAKDINEARCQEAERVEDTSAAQA